MLIFQIHTNFSNQQVAQLRSLIHVQLRVSMLSAACFIRFTYTRTDFYNDHTCQQRIVTVIENQAHGEIQTGKERI
jgi:hypothetical protein